MVLNNFSTISTENLWEEDRNLNYFLASKNVCGNETPNGILKLQNDTKKNVKRKRKKKIREQITWKLKYKNLIQNISRIAYLMMIWSVQEASDPY